MAHNPRLRNVLTLYTLADDIQCHRVRLVLAAKGVSYEREPVDAAKPPSELAELNPYVSAPTLIDRDLTLYETTVICEYIDERFPHPQLMPGDPVARARVRLFLFNFEKELFVHVSTLESRASRSNEKAMEKARAAIRDRLTQLVPIFTKNRFMLGDDFSMLDVSIAPLLWRLDHYGIDLPKSAAPLAKYAERIFQRPAYIEALTPSEKVMRK